MGIELNLFLAQLRTPFANGLMEGISFLAESYAMIFVVCFFYWCHDKRQGRVMALTILSSASVNAFFKNLFRISRPFQVDERLTAIRVETATGYSFPSGHTQNAATLATFFAIRSRTLRALLIAVSYVVLVGFSRIYLGVHFPSDVVAGLLFGVLWCFVAHWINRFVERHGGGWFYLLFTIPAFASLVTLLPLYPTKPADPKDTLTMFGLTLGAVLGFILEQRHVRFDPAGPVKIKLQRFAVGILIVLVVEVGLKLLFPATALFRVVRYFAVGIVATYCCPMLFGLIESKRGN
ncbi:phosphatase PAP2 family protein [Feifania hominis]|uniref:Phosphatase PAP2 family protein n=1 Tax=Feifania hominis TaxID=2763660 RepID=A0A926DGS7_9FIRM|nr:phosphatase PAP2 family protein [Feifania hominis]MBC8537014.1 phosphatase PAP2 family protein [Feifania hominis]